MQSFSTFQGPVKQVIILDRATRCFRLETYTDSLFELQSIGTSC